MIGILKEILRGLYDFFLVGWYDLRRAHSGTTPAPLARFVPEYGSSWVIMGGYYPALIGVDPGAIIMFLDTRKVEYGGPDMVAWTEYWTSYICRGKIWSVEYKSIERAIRQGDIKRLEDVEENAFDRRDKYAKIHRQESKVRG